MGSGVATYILLCGLVAATCGDEVPAFIWGDLEHKSGIANPLECITSADFERTLRSELTADPLLIAFVEETLSVEDLSRRDASGATSLPYLRANLERSLYLPAVRSAVEALEKIADGSGNADHIELTASGVSGEVRPGSSVVLVRLADAQPDDTRAHMLRRHDAFMAETVRKLKAKYGSVVAVYTASYPSWSVPAEEDGSRFRRHLMQAQEATADASVTNNASDSRHVFNLNYALIAISNITVSTRGSEPVNLDLTKEPLYDKSDGEWVVLKWAQQNIEVALNISNADNKMGYLGYWELGSANVTNTSSQSTFSLSTSAVHALHNFSYHCGLGVELTGQNVTLTLVNLQLEPFFYGNASKFGDAIDCVGFFSMPIWSGIFVLTVILAIFFYGVVSIMDIRTMDRFDDPKGKTITINASE